MDFSNPREKLEWLRKLPSGPASYQMQKFQVIADDGRISVLLVHRSWQQDDVVLKEHELGQLSEISYKAKKAGTPYLTAIELWPNYQIWKTVRQDENVKDDLLPGFLL